jgi:hypothetical protein
MCTGMKNQFVFLSRSANDRAKTGSQSGNEKGKIVFSN